MSATADTTTFERALGADRGNNELLALLALWLAEVSAEAVRIAIDTNGGHDPVVGEPRS